MHLMSPDGMFTAVNVLEPVSTDIISDEKETTISAIGHTVGYKAASGDDSNLGNEMKKALIGKTEFFSFLDQHYTSQKVENELAFYFHFPVSSTEQKKTKDLHFIFLCIFAFCNSAIYSSYIHTHAHTYIHTFFHRD